MASTRTTRVMLLLVLSFGACTFNFQNADQVVDRRILAIEVDPPEIANGYPLPAQIDVRALVVDPTDPRATASYEWRACSATDSSAGRRLAGMLSPTATSTDSGRCDESTPANLVDSGTAELDNLALEAPVPSSVTTALAQPDLGEPADALRFQLKVSGPSGDLYGFKNVTITRTLPAGQAPNNNPVLAGVLLDGATVSPGSSTQIAYGTCSSDKQKKVTDSATGQQVMVCSHTLMPLFDDAQAEYYVGTTTADGQVSLGQPVQMRERLRFAFFTDQGSFTQGMTEQPSSSTQPSNLGIQTEWEEPSPKAGLATIWIVTRDGRGGESWMQFQIVLQ